MSTSHSLLYLAVLWLSRRAEVTAAGDSEFHTVWVGFLSSAQCVESCSSPLAPVFQTTVMHMLKERLDSSLTPGSACYERRHSAHERLHTRNAWTRLQQAA
eukprot:212876-Amphidinium_carterae.1